MDKKFISSHFISCSWVKKKDPFHLFDSFSGYVYNDCLTSNDKNKTHQMVGYKVDCPNKKKSNKPLE